jgi:hypothetical protein
MKRVTPLLFVYLLTCCFVFPSYAPAKTSERARDQFTGRYELRYLNVRATLNVQLLPDNKIRFSLVALLNTAGGETRNGVAEGTIELKGDRAVYQSGACRISMKFINSRVVVEESNVDECGFGAFVTAKGTYLRKSRKPRFDS